MTRQCGRQFSRLDVPQANRLIAAARGECRAVRGKRYGIDDIRMSAERRCHLSRLDVPQANRLFTAARGESRTVRAKGFVIDCIRMSHEGQCQLSRVGLTP